MSFESSNIEGISYVIMPGKVQPDFSKLDIHNGTYKLWREVWQDVFTEAGNPGALLADDFLRQDFICAIHKDNQAIACHLYTLFNIKQAVTLDHRYFSIFPKETMEYFRQRNSNYLMSMEFLTVHPEWRKQSTNGIPIGPIISGLGINVFQAVGADAAIAPARKKTKVDQTASKFGFDCLKANVTRGNLDCDLVALFPENIKRYPDPTINSWIDRLWATRIDMTQLTTHKQSSIQAA